MATTQGDESGLVKTTVRIPQDLYDWLRGQAFHTKTTMGTIVAEALTDLRIKYAGYTS